VTAAVGPGLSLDGLVAETAPSSWAKDGFHHRHIATAGAMPAIARAFEAAGYFLEMITAEDWRAERERMRLVYTFNRFGTPADRHLITAELEVGEAAPSVTGAFPAADWFEREVYDMYGIRFDGHPDLKRILLPDDADFHALLKDFGRIEDAPTEDDDAEGDG